MEDGSETGGRTAGGSRSREEYRVQGDRVVEKIRDLLREGSVRHVVIKNDEGRTLIEFPVTLGVAGAVLLPVWAAIGAIAAVVANCSVEVERVEGHEVEEEERGEA